MENFEQKLARLEELSADIKRTDISLEDALKDFEEGITLSKTLEKELEKIEGKIQILTNQPVPPSPVSQGIPPQMDLFSAADAVTGSSGAPDSGLRQNG